MMECGVRRSEIHNDAMRRCRRLLSSINNTNIMYIFLILSCSWLTLSLAFDTSSPVIGIVSQTYSYSNNSNSSVAQNKQESSVYYLIPASYVKWLESAGARSIPIPYHASKQEAEDIFYQVNGLLFPGGGSDVPEAVQHLWDLAMASNKNGTFFPIWGTCLGFEYMIQLASGTSDNDGPLKSGFQAENVSLPLLLWSSTDRNNNNNNSTVLKRKILRGTTTAAAAVSSSRLYANDDIQRIVTRQPVTMNNHERGVEPQDFLANKRLTDLFVVTSVNRDLAGRPFVSTMESKQPDLYPYFGVQYHPEKNPFEYGTYPGTNTPYQDINHSPTAIQFSLHLAQFFVNLTRHNHLVNQDCRRRHAYTLPERYPLVNSYQMIYTNIPFEQVYVIPNNDNDYKQMPRTASYHSTQQVAL